MTQPQQQQSPPGVEGRLEPRADHGEESYRGSGRLAGKATVITGADSGIGRAVAIAFAREGADVLISYLEEDEDARETERLVEEAGRVNFTASLAQLLAERGIRANSVAPGPIWTPLIPSTMPPEQVETFGNDTPMGRPGQPVEVAPVYVMLAADEASYVSGARVGITGGSPIA